MHGFIDSLITESLIHWVSGSLIHRFIDRRFFASLIHWTIPGSLVHWFIGSLVESLIHCFVTSLFLWFTYSLIHRFIGSLMFICSFTQLCTDSFMPFPWHLSHHFLIRWCTSQLQPVMASASQKRSYRPLISYRRFRNFCRGTCRALPGKTW